MEGPALQLQLQLQSGRPAAACNETPQQQQHRASNNKSVGIDQLQLLLRPEFMQSITFNCYQQQKGWNSQPG
jgi:hypothetical protein